MKTYLLIAGQYYYPSGGVGDWVGVYETREEIENKIKPGLNVVGKDAFIIDNETYDWYEIVDLKEWIYQ